MFVVLAAAAAFSFIGGPSATLRQVGFDPLTFPGTISGTTVGAVNATNGRTTVSVYQTNRFTGDASAAMAFSTSNDGGMTWREGLLPGITKATNAANPDDRVTFPSIVWNVKYRQFLVSTLPISNTPSNGDDDTLLSPVVSRSSDGVNWSTPVPIESGSVRPEKNYLACDNSFTSPYYGNCYVAYDDNDTNDLFSVNVSKDGGLTWGPTVTSADSHTSYGGQPVILANGTVVVVTEDSNGYDAPVNPNQVSFVSTNGGASFSAANEISPITAHTVAGNMRTQTIPTSGIDASGNIYTVWQDCRFRANCSANDLVMSESTNGGTAWSTPARVNLDAVTSTVDHFLPTLGVQSGFSGTTLALSYYAFPNANCTTATCALTPYESQSTNGGGTWTTPIALAPAMNLTWLPLTGAGYMVGDYFESNFRLNVFGDAPPLTVATAPVGGVLNERTDVSLISTSAFGFFDRTRETAGRAGGFSLTPAMQPIRRAPRVILRRRGHHPM